MTVKPNDVQVCDNYVYEVVILQIIYDGCHEMHQ